MFQLSRQQSTGSSPVPSSSSAAATWQHATRYDRPMPGLHPSLHHGTGAKAPQQTQTQPPAWIWREPSKMNANSALVSNNAPPLPAIRLTSPDTFFGQEDPASVSYSAALLLQGGATTESVNAFPTDARQSSNPVHWQETGPQTRVHPQRQQQQVQHHQQHAQQRVPNAEQHDRQPLVRGSSQKSMQAQPQRAFITHPTFGAKLQAYGPAAGLQSARHSGRPLAPSLGFPPSHFAPLAPASNGAMPTTLRGMESMPYVAEQYSSSASTSTAAQVIEALSHRNEQAVPSNRDGLTLSPLPLFADEPSVLLKSSTTTSARSADELPLAAYFAADSAKVPTLPPARPTGVSASLRDTTTTTAESRGSSLQSQVRRVPQPRASTTSRNVESTAIPLVAPSPVKAARPRKLSRLDPTSKTIRRLVFDVQAEQTVPSMPAIPSPRARPAPAPARAVPAAEIPAATVPQPLHDDPEVAASSKTTLSSEHVQKLKDFLRFVEESEDICQFLSLSEYTDNYMVAAVFVYFCRAQLQAHEFTRANFFAMLHLAHVMEEDKGIGKLHVVGFHIGCEPDITAETLKAGAGPNYTEWQKWREALRQFDALILVLWQRMDHRAALSHKLCDMVMAAVPSRLWGRVRHLSDVKRYMNKSR